jgi:oligopeptide transport system substrate-binding protein
MLLVLSMFLAACGGKDSADGDKKKEGDGGKKSDVPQELRVNIRTEPFSLHPGLANDSVSGNVLRNTFEGLTRIGKNGEPENAMAEDIQISDDQLTYTFKLRDAKWTNGDPVTAEDFEYAWKWVIDPANQSQYAEILHYVKNGAAISEGKMKPEELGVKAIDDKTLEVTLENPTPYFLELTAFYTYLPINSKIAKENPNWYKDAGELYTTNGPFKMTTWDHNEKIVLEKNENYWDADTVKLEKVEMYMINDEMTEISMFDNDELDWAGEPFGSLPTDAIQRLKDEGSLKIKTISGVYWYKFNTQKEPLNNVHMRKALAYAIDRKSIVENVTQSGEVPAMAAVPPTNFPENEKGYFKDGDVEAAKKELEIAMKELGYKDVSDIPPITISYNTLESHAKIAQAIQDMWKKELGIEVSLDNQEWAVYIDKLHNGDYQIGRMGWLADFNDPITFLELYKDKNGGNNNTFWENAKFKELLDKSAKETDKEARYQLLKDAEKIFMDEMPVAPIYFYTFAYVHKDNLKDLVIGDTGDAQLKWAYFE